MTGQKTQCDRVETLEREARCRNQSRTFADGKDNQFREVFDRTAENGRWANSTDLIVLASIRAQRRGSEACSGAIRRSEPHLISTQRSILTCVRRCACPMRQSCSRGGLRPPTARSLRRKAPIIRSRSVRCSAMSGARGGRRGELLGENPKTGGEPVTADNGPFAATKKGQPATYPCYSRARVGSQTV